MNAVAGLTKLHGQLVAGKALSLLRRPGEVLGLVAAEQRLKGK